MRVLFTLSAERHLLSALDYIRRGNPSAALRFRDRALKSLERLQAFPESGRHIPEFPDLPYREVIVPPYRFFYRVKDDVVWIVNVWHDAQLPGEPIE
jgi:plasmid stabilization system protein ParE